MRTAAGRVFEVGTWVVMAAVLVQFLLAGLGVFTDAGFLFWHAAVNSLVVGLLPLLLVLIGWLGGVPGRVLRLGAAIFGLTVLQSLLLAPYHMNAPTVVRAISSLHVLNAILILWVALQLLERTRAWSHGKQDAGAAIPGR
jgi:hypothetical protein